MKKKDGKGRLDGLLKVLVKVREKDVCGTWGIGVGVMAWRRVYNEVSLHA